METSFTPTPDIIVILNALLDKFENRAKRNRIICGSGGTHHETRSIKISLTELPLPSYFSQTDPEPRLITNKQIQALANHNLITLTWLPGETNHILQSASLSHGPHSTQYEQLYKLLRRTPISNHRAHLESLLLAEKYRYQKSDWRPCALDHILDQIRAGKSPSPFSLTDSDFNLDLLAILQAVSTLTAETPHRVFSVRVFNDTKRFDYLKSAFIRLARRANPEWKSLNNEDLLRELNLVANPTYIHLSGCWELTDLNGQIINLDTFSPSVGFPASQIADIQRLNIRADSVLCIENLTSFYEFLRAHTTRNTNHATICIMGNPSPSIRRFLKLIPEEIPIHLWSDMDYGGFNILAHLRRQISPRIQPYLMDIATFEKYAHLSRPLAQSDRHNLKRLLLNPILKDLRPTIEHILQRGLKLEQEAIQI